MFICNFGTELDDLTIKQKKDPQIVMEVLRKTGKFSCFEVDGHLAKTLDALKGQGKILYTPSDYPWQKVIVLEPKEQTNDR